MRKFLLGLAIIILLIAVGCEKKPELPYYTVDNAGELSIYSQSFPVPDKKLFQIPDKAVLDLWVVSTPEYRQVGYFLAEINGEVFKFLFDTGSDRNVLYPKGLSKLGLSTAVDDDYYVLLKSLKISGCVFKNELFHGMPNFNVGADGYFDGIIGRAFYKKAKTLSINFQEGYVKINPTVPLSESIPIINRRNQQFEGDVIIEDASIEGKKCVILFDSGAQFSVLRNSTFGFEELDVNRMDVNLTTFYAERKKLWYFHKIKELLLGNVNIKNASPFLLNDDDFEYILPILMDTGIDLLLGTNDFFSKAELTIDFINKRCWITKVN